MSGSVRLARDKVGEFWRTAISSAKPATEAKAMPV
jgi:hypothetical protein